MQIINRAPTLTGVAIGGTIIRPAATLLSMFTGEVSLLTSRRITPTIPSPLEDLREIPPTLITVFLVSPGVG